MICKGYEGEGIFVKNKVPKVTSLYKALNLLKYFDDAQKELGVTELAETSGLPKSTVHNILQTFECCGFVTQDYRNNKYSIGSAAVDLFCQYRASHHIDYRATLCLREISDKFKVDAYLGLKQGDDIVYLCAETYNHGKGDYINRVGTRIPLHCTAMGKILLGYSGIEERTAYYSQPLRSYTQYTITDMSTLCREVEKDVYRGYALSESCFVEGVFSLAVPIIVGAEPIKYALEISALKPFSDYDLKEYLRFIQDKSKIVASYLVGSST